MLVLDGASSYLRMGGSTVIADDGGSGDITQLFLSASTGGAGPSRSVYGDLIVMTGVPESETIDELAAFFLARSGLTL
ncbi:hypothetical protein [Microbacterium sp. ZXX196]|uniref:hypothetical protein n=1 Tax=Microbacterium sp. ZXX196 TaxID=2609291 RepID=UPI0012B97E8C|nr:hypothetical protein [Microbacterium sp. ZXX196]MTE23269.1 hypothetical protein [Microbacterium sp. ZXX196]